MEKAFLDRASGRVIGHHGRTNRLDGGERDLRVDREARVGVDEHGVVVIADSGEEVHDPVDDAIHALVQPGGPCWSRSTSHSLGAQGGGRRDTRSTLEGIVAL